MRRGVAHWNDSLCDLFSPDIIKDYASIIYKTSNGQFGVEAAKITPQRPVQHGFNGKFSQVSLLIISNISLTIAPTKIRHARQQRAQHQPQQRAIYWLRSGLERQDLIWNNTLSVRIDSNLKINREFAAQLFLDLFHFTLWTINNSNWLDSVYIGRAFSCNYHN